MTEDEQMILFILLVFNDYEVPTDFLKQKVMEDSGRTCTICMEDILIGDEVYELEPCSHVFHTECDIEHWVLNHGSCPNCRCVVNICNQS